MNDEEHVHDGTIAILLDGTEKHRADVPQLSGADSINAVVEILDAISKDASNATHQITFAQVCSCGDSQAFQTTEGSAEVLQRGFEVYKRVRGANDAITFKTFLEDLALQILLSASEKALAGRLKRLFNDIFSGGHTVLIHVRRR